MTIKANFTEADQNWKDGSTTYWFELVGSDYGTEREFNGEVYGVAESGGETQILDYESYPIEEDDAVVMLVRKEAVVTDEMRKEASGL